MSTPKWIQYGMPSIERPFGLAMWPIFEEGFKSVMGYRPQDFRFKPGETPLSTLGVTAASLITYYVVIFGGRELMRGRPAFNLNGLFKAHNLGLTVISGALLLLFIEQLTPILYNHGLYYGICHYGGGWTKELVILYYLNYLTKYLELADTVFLFLKKKPLTFLHTYHHGATALLCFSQLLGHTSVSWVPITLNLMVHVVMYWYYFQAARGVKVWWKQYITIMQITQFVIDLVFVYWASYNYFVHTYFPNIWSYGTCAGEEFAAFAGMGILTSYLFLFIGFYLATYKKPPPKKRGRSTSALIEMKDEKVPTVSEVRRRFSSGNKDKPPQISNEPAANGHATSSAISHNEPETPASTRVTRSRKA